MPDNYVKVVRFGDNPMHEVHAFDDRNADDRDRAQALVAAAPRDAQVSVWRPFMGVDVVGENRSEPS